MGVLWVEKLFGDSHMCLTCVLHMLKVTLFWFLDKSGVYILSDFYVFGLKMRVLEAKKLVGVGLTCLKLETLITFYSLPKPVRDAHSVDLMLVNQYFKCKGFIFRPLGTDIRPRGLIPGIVGLKSDLWGLKSDLWFRQICFIFE